LRALVTGATGFVESQLCHQLLRAGYDVSVLIRGSPEFELTEDIKSSLTSHGLDPAYENIEEALREAQSDQQASR
jgi:nucleoside-diphosphate-sugar epimerase